MGEPTFWDNPEAAQRTVGEVKKLQAVLKPLDQLHQQSEDLNAAVELAEEDPSFEETVASELEAIEPTLDEAEFQALFTGSHDSCDAIMTINARDGGTDANDWAEMMLRMYIRWAELHEYSVELLDRSDNEEAGINSASLLIRGPMAYGFLKGETGQHRLVRISPFNSEGKRQTSFAAVDVSPEIADDSDEIEVTKEDVEEQTFRASGAGGQHVNKTSSAIRLIHKETGLVVQCQNERSQHKNRATAYKMMRSLLARQEEAKREAEQVDKYNKQAKTGFGSQIRNYFLHPDQRVKDARTGHLVGNFHAVLDGQIQEFLEAYLRWLVAEDDV
ncbi:Peptide chain release factor 2 [Planctomycetales bacterium 10988]|nr:Peptide chain release factor 2 [Planctomycetales bacterium 10988]